MELVDAAARGREPEAPPGYFEALPGRVRMRIESRRPTVRWPAWSWAVGAALLLAVVTPLTLRQGPPLETPLAAPAAPADASRGPEARAGSREQVSEASPRARAEEVLRSAAPSRAAQPPARPSGAVDEMTHGLQAKAEERQAEPVPPRTERPMPRVRDEPEGPPSGSAAQLGQTTAPPTGGIRTDDAVEVARAASAPPPPPPAQRSAPGAAPSAPPAPAASGPALSDLGFARAPGSEGRGAIVERKEKDSRRQDASREASAGAAAGGADRDEGERTTAANDPEAGPAAAAGAKTSSDDGRAFAEGVHRDARGASTLADLRRKRERWRALAEELGTGASADAARVQVVEAGVEAWRLGRQAADRDLARRDARAYLARPDAVQRPRVGALLRSLDEAR
jgi:hypothetical protein